MRYKPAGWRYESHRHYLAAKGISSKRYYAMDYKGAAQKIHWLFDDGRPKTEDFAQQMKMQQVETLKSEVMGKLQKAQETGEITTDNAQRFMNGDFTDETKDFLHRDTESYTQYRGDVMHKLDWHLSTYSAKPKMPWANVEKGPKNVSIYMSKEEHQGGGGLMPWS
jgi:hypothetical protein